ncbi:acyltransferase family protein [Streptomyces sp. NPDC018321]
MAVPGGAPLGVGPLDAKGDRGTGRPGRARAAVRRGGGGAAGRAGGAREPPGRSGRPAVPGGAGGGPLPLRGPDTGRAEFVWGRPPGELFPDAHRYFAFGRLGVDLFFLISGFVICMSAWGRTPRDFFISRVTRLHPMYWVAIIVSASVVYLFDTPFGHPNPRVLFANFTMLQTPLGVDNLDSVYWTLWPELCFYLTFAVVVWKGLTYQRVVVFCGLWTVAAVLAPSAGTLLVNPTSAPFFIAGMAFYLMYRFRPTPLLWGIVAMSWLLALHFLLAPHGGRNNWDTWAPWRGWLVLSTTVFFLLIARSRSAGPPGSAGAG